MKATKILWLLTLLMLVLWGCEYQERPEYSDAVGRYVRFNLIVDADGRIIPPGKMAPDEVSTEHYIQRTVNTLKIPVSLTSEPLSEEVQVWFSYDTTGPYSAFTIEPANVLSFNGTKLSDTIILDYHERWDAEQENKFVFTIDSVSDPTIHIGNLNQVEPNDSLVITLEELFLRYSFPVKNQLEILGQEGETMVIDVEFPDGFFPPEVEGNELVIPGFSDFEYTLEQLEYDDDDTKISYLITLDEELDDEMATYRASFELKELDRYNLAGNNMFSVTKWENVPRDVSLNTAAHFLDPSDNNYRTYGEQWIDYMDRDSCRWYPFFAFTTPVEVSADHPNAVLYDDQGTQDPLDDIYHHAFRIGFVSPNAGGGLTTNPFNMKRWFDNESSDSDNSPGFNIPQALEFYPDDNGTSATSGIVKVIEQDLIIGGKQEDGSIKTYTIRIEGEGEYYELGNSIFEVELELRVTNNELFGGTISAYYRIFNTSEYDEPSPITDTECFEERVL